MNLLPSRATRQLALLLITAFVSGSSAQSLPVAITNATEAKTEGKALVNELLSQIPTADFTQAGTLKIRDGNGKRSEWAVQFITSVTPTNWRCCYSVGTPGGDIRALEVVQTPGQPGKYRFGRTALPGSDLTLADISIPEAAAQAFAGSDFSFTDLGLEFFRWPDQRLVRRELCRTRSCKVLESINPQPTTNSYSLVRSWIDRETLGIVQARAYDAKGKLLKEFSPKGVRKVNDRWQVQEMEVRNVQTGSRSRIEFTTAAGP